MDNFNLQTYLASGQLHANSETLTEAKKQGYDDREDESLGARKGAEKGKKQSMKARRDDSYGKFGKRDAEKKGKNKINKEEIEVKEDARTDAEQEGYKDGFDDAKDDVKDALSKMKVSELKAKIKETILAELSLSEAEEEVDVDIDVEAPAETSSEPGLTSDEMEIQNALKSAYETAVSIGDEKLSNQIANSITFFTKTHIVPRD